MCVFVRLSVCVCVGVCRNIRNILYMVFVCLFLHVYRMLTQFNQLILNDLLKMS